MIEEGTIHFVYIGQPMQHRNIPFQVGFIFVINLCFFSKNRFVLRRSNINRIQ